MAPRGRPSPLADPEFAKSVAQAFVDGHSRAEMCEIFDVKDPNTISRWRRDSRVKVHTLPLAEDRVIQISRKIDSTIEARLQHTEKLSIKELLDIRKEFLGGALRAQTEKADDEVVGQAQALIDDNPDAVRNFLDALDKQPVNA